MSRSHLLVSRYDSKWKDYNERTHRLLLERLSLQRGRRILDVGCGTGELEKKLLAKSPGIDVTGIDRHEGRIAFARQKCASYSNVHWQAADAHALPFSGGSFDVVVSASSFHYYEEPLRVLMEIGRILKPGGRFFLLDWCRDFVTMKFLDLFMRLGAKDYHDCYSEQEIRKLIENASFFIQTCERVKISPLWGLVFVGAEKQ